jgi:Zn-dependent protease with chaperone function
MMFALRGAMVALGFFGVVYCMLSLLVVCAWRCVNLLRRKSAIAPAHLLFALRIFPLVGSAFLTLAFALPAFFRLESGVIDEDIGTFVFTICTVLLLVAGLFRVLTAQIGASRVVGDWLEGAHVLDTGAGVQTLQTQPGPPPLLLYGVSNPKVLVSEAAINRLSPDELRVAVQHEIGHVRSRDNLKKLILHASAFPGMKSLDRAWQEAAEFSADESAVSNSDDAIDLAAALLKLADLVPLQDPPAFTTGLVDLTALVKLRVERLLAWDETSARGVQLRWWCFLLLFLASVPYAVAHYGQALLFTHRATEWFVR